VNGSQRVVLWAWLAMIGLATARSVGGGRGLPQPSVYLGSGVLFTLYLGAAGFLGALPAVLAVGTDLTAVALPYLRGQATGPLDTIAAALERVSGAAPTQAPAPAVPGSPRVTLRP
jgi:hypothetical protein